MDEREHQRPLPLLVDIEVPEHQDAVVVKGVSQPREDSVGEQFAPVDTLDLRLRPSRAAVVQSNRSCFRSRRARLLVAADRLT